MLKRRIARAVNSVLGRYELHVARGRSPALRPSLYQIAVLALGSTDRRLRVAVVGANDGKTNDPIYATLMGPLREHSAVLLVEPQKSLVPHLTANYAPHPCHRIANAAVGTGEPLALYAVRSEYFGRIRPAYARDWPVWRAPTGVTSADRQNVIDWLRSVETDDFDPEEAVEELRVETSPLPDLLREADMDERVDVLQIDTEGFDDAIIYNSAIETTRPAIIMFESKLLPSKRKEDLLAHLQPRYRLHEIGDDTMAIRLP